LTRREFACSEQRARPCDREKIGCRLHPTNQNPACVQIHPHSNSPDERELSCTRRSGAATSPRFFKGEMLSVTLVSEANQDSPAIFLVPAGSQLRNLCCGMTGRPADLSPAIPEPHREKIRKLAERVYKDTAQSGNTVVRLTAQEIDDVVRDINKEIEAVNAGLKGSPWSESYTALVTMRDVVQNFSASLSMRRASLGQYDTVWPGSRWKGG
jgi:hypothetical protein